MSEVTEDKKADAEAGEKLDKVLAAMDSIAKRMDALEAKKADEEEPKADSVYQAFGDAAPRPLLGEDLPAYRRRLASGMKAHSAKLKSVNLGAIKDETAFSFMEDQIYADAMSAALKPVDLPAGQLREIKSRDTTGRQISTFVGEPRTWMASHQGVRRRLSHIERNPR